MTNVDPNVSNLMSTLLYKNVNLHPILHYHGTKAAEDRKYSTLDAMNSSKLLYYITPEELNNKLCMGLKKTYRTLKSAMPQFICSTGSLTIRFRTGKSHLRYKQLAKVFGSCYADYPKSKTKSIQGYVGGVVYTNKLVLYKFIPCENETIENNGSSLRNLIEVVGLMYSLHLYNRGNFKDGLFKLLLRKFGNFSDLC